MKSQRRRNYPSACMALLVLLSSAVQADLNEGDYEGWAITVLSGDTVRVLDGSNRMTKVRLESIDAPQRGQSYGDESRKYLASLLSGKEVLVKTSGSDDFGNILATIWVEPPDCSSCKKTLEVNYGLVKAGMAWWYLHFAKTQSNKDRKRYESAESEAKTRKLGLWADPDPEAPWDWRVRNDDHLN